MYVQKLEKLGKNWTDKNKIWDFKKGVLDPNYDNKLSIHKETFAELINIVRNREQDIDWTALDGSQKNKCIRRVILNGDESDDDAQRKSENNKRIDSTSGKSHPFIPFIPNFLFNTLDSAANSNFKNIGRW